MRIDDFDSFHRAVHGQEPFPWQRRLLEQVVKKRRWPPVLDLPTGSGKTTCIDIAIFALALDATSPPEKRWCPRRIAMVVDRRVAVDQAADRGKKILKALTTVGAPRVVHEVAVRLKSLSRTAKDPLGVFTLRGGIPKDDGWIRSPDQPLVLASTVDQIGSRLLFQGYGVSRSMRPVHAGLLANDLLLFLDEVHLSYPFAETLKALEALRKSPEKSVQLPQRFFHVFMSATPGVHFPTAFRLKDQERSPQSPLGKRLNVSKPCRWVEVQDQKALEKACVREAQNLLERHSVVAVIVNRVGSAITVTQGLQKEVPGDTDVFLLTGRMRPLDRDDLLSEIRSRIMAGRDRSLPQRKLVLVSTQCIEAGADFDFDAMVTEAASLDALRQRFGRLDRLGAYGKSEAVILFDKSRKEDRIYGEAIQNTVRWLRNHLSRKKIIDFGFLKLPVPPKEKIGPLLTPSPRAPVLLPAYLDLWIQTSPIPSKVPEMALWLHGPQSNPPDVQVIWRTDLTENDLIGGDRERLMEIVGSVPPTSLEAVSVPYAMAKSWLAGRTPEEESDVEGGSRPPLEGAGEPDKEREKLAFRWAGDESECIRPDQLRPGDTIVVPSKRGGLWNRSFSPEAKDPVPDLAERASLMGRGIPLLRLHPEVLAGLGVSVNLDDQEETCRLLKDQAEASPPGWRRLWLQRLSSENSAFVVHGSNIWTVLQGRRLSASVLRESLGLSDSFEDGAALNLDDEDSPHVGRHVSLSTHSAQVEQLAHDFARELGLPQPLAEDLALAGWLHDIGKADPRFQILLRGGSEIDYLKEDELLAKSGMFPQAKSAHRLAHLKSGYPRGARHEVQSLAMLEKESHFLRSQATDPELVLYLISSHHGWCRPFAPAVEDKNPVDVFLKLHESRRFGQIQIGPQTSANEMFRLDSSLGDRFWKMVRRYGWQELCWLEAIFRLADHRASDEEAISEVPR